MYQLLLYADNVNLLSKKKMNAIKKTQILVATSKELSLEVNTEKAKCMFMPHE
jgi:hypothetical protein